MLQMNEIKNWDAKAIDAKVTELRVELFNLKMQAATTGLEKTHRLSDTKKNIARLLTAKNAKGDK